VAVRRRSSFSPSSSLIVILLGCRIGSLAGNLACAKLPWILIARAPSNCHLQCPAGIQMVLLMRLVRPS